MVDKRAQIKGTGPRRNKLKIFHKLGEVSPATLRELNAILDEYTQSDISTDGYGISRTIDYENTHGAKAEFYRQVLMQGKSPEDYAADDRNEYRYSNWLTDKFEMSNTILDVSKHFSSVCRFRLSETHPHSEIKWHIDTDTSVACRAQICVNENDSVFEFKDRDGVHQLRMKPGEIWFINTGWNHRVVSGEDMRRVAVWSFHFDAVRDKDALFK